MNLSGESSTDLVPHDVLYWVGVAAELAGEEGAVVGLQLVVHRVLPEVAQHLTKLFAAVTAAICRSAICRRRIRRRVLGRGPHVLPDRQGQQVVLEKVLGRLRRRPRLLVAVTKFGKIPFEFGGFFSGSSYHFCWFLLVFAGLEWP